MPIGGSVRSQSFLAGRVVIAVAATDNRIRAAVDALFVDLRAPGAEPSLVIEIVEAPQGLDVGPTGGPFLSFMGPAGAMRELVRLVNRAALDHDPERLHLHASAVTVEDHLLVLSAPSGTGKTTTAAALLLGGATYLTDETIALDAGVGAVHGFPKPLTARRGAVELLPELAAGAVRVNPASAPPLLIPVSALGVPWRLEAPPFVVAVLQRDKTIERREEPLIEPMSRADACVALVQESLDFDRFGDGALETVARLCAASHCLQVRLGEPRATAAALVDIISGLGPVKPRALTGATGSGFVPSCAGGPEHGAGQANWMPDGDVRWVGLDGEVVLHHGRTKAIVSLRAPAAQWWLSILGRSFAEDERRETSGLFALLTSEGFVRKAQG